MSRCGTLVLAWGNPGRRDDGLGPAFAEALGAHVRTDLALSADYQLQVEDAAELVGCKRVLFVDADRSGRAPFRLQALRPEEGEGLGLGFTSHGISPARLLRLARDLFGAVPEAWLMGIRGYDFDGFGEGLSCGAQENLSAAVSAAAEVLAAGGAGSFAATAAEAEMRGGT